MVRAGLLLLVADGDSIKGLIYDNFLVQVSMIIFSMTFYLSVYHEKNDHFLYCTRKW